MVSLSTTQLSHSKTRAHVHFDDPTHPTNLLTLGITPGGVILVVSTERDARIRIISARKATPNEIHRYQEEQA